ncbi:terminase small subunit [Shouchella clausii]|uniref:terminase small subunit n=1 Tax=Shouchella clausii TaxID=79880 RepID=UPI003462BADF
MGEGCNQAKGCIQGCNPKIGCNRNYKRRKKVFVEAEGLTDKQKLFCIYYIKSFNATMAAVNVRR